MDDNTYKYCYNRCSLCNKGGDEFDNNCKECLKDDNNNYLYHFIYNEKGRCLNESERPSDTYLDLDDNTYKLNYERYFPCIKNNNCFDYFRETYMIKNISEIKEDIIKAISNMIFQITTTDNQKNNTNNNISTINLNNCENILKEKYGINEALPLIIYKIDYYFPDKLIPIVEYEIYHPIDFLKLDLKYCQNILIKINVPVLIVENNLFKYDPESDFYNDYCDPYTTDEGTDILLIDRRKLFIKNYLSLCQNNCEFAGYNKDNKQSTCNCIAESKMDNISDNEENSNKLSTKFEIEEEIHGFGSNVKTIKCTKTLYSKDGLKNNISSYILLMFIVIFTLSIIIFVKYEYRFLLNIIKNILDSKKNFCYKNNNEQIANIISYSDTKRRVNNSFTNYPPKKNKKFISLEKVGRDAFTINNKKKSKKKVEDIKNEYGTISLTKKDEGEISTLNDYELNSFEYSEALLKDKRKYYGYYLSLIMRNQLIAFAFFYKNDYNLKSIKICIFCLSFSFYYTTNYFYFSEKVIHKIYEDKGKYDFSYFLPKIIAAFFVAYFLTVLIKFIFLSERYIRKIKLKTYYQENEIVSKAKRKITIRYIVFFSLGIILLIFLWMLLSSFGAVFRNTQIIVFENTLISFAFSLIYPFIYDIIPCLFRMIALHYRKENLYKASKILQIF